MSFKILSKHAVKIVSAKCCTRQDSTYLLLLEYSIRNDSVKIGNGLRMARVRLELKTALIKM